jgi:hypothetical protein
MLIEPSPMAGDVPGLPRLSDQDSMFQIMNTAPEQGSGRPKAKSEIILLFHNVICLRVNWSGNCIADRLKIRGIATDVQ